MIRGILVLAGLTIKEAIWRRVFLAALVISALYLGFAFLPLHIRTSFFVGLDLATARNNTGRIFAWLGCGTIKFFGAVLAVALSAGAITSEIDRGVLAVIVPKPIPRCDLSGQMARNRLAAGRVCRRLGSITGLCDLASNRDLSFTYLGRHSGGGLVPCAIYDIDPLFFDVCDLRAVVLSRADCGGGRSRRRFAAQPVALAGHSPAGYA